MEDWRHEIVEMAAESSGYPRPDNAMCTKECGAVWDTFDDLAYEFLESWVSNNVSAVKREYGALDLWNEEGPYLIYMTMAGEGVGIWDGRWDRFFVNPKTAISKLQAYLESNLGHAYSDLEIAIENAAYDTVGGFAEAEEEEGPPDRETLDESIVIKDCAMGYACYNVFAMGKKIDFRRTLNAAVKTARKWSKDNNYYPNIYYINDHGNVDLLDYKGNIVKSWV
jgi:hypothetical protein